MVILSCLPSAARDDELKDKKRPHLTSCDLRHSLENFEDFDGSLFNERAVCSVTDSDRSSPLLSGLFDEDGEDSLGLPFGSNDPLLSASRFGRDGVTGDEDDDNGVNSLLGELEQFILIPPGQQEDEAVSWPLNWYL